MKKIVITAVSFAAILVFTTVMAYDKGPSKAAAAKTTKARVNLAAVKLKNVEFGFNKRKFSPAFESELNNVVKLMKENDGSLKISGHADNIGAYLYNWHLSADRSKQVKEYLVSKGADSSKIAATEFGDTKPIATNKTAAGRQKNRRVEMSFL